MDFFCHELNACPCHLLKDIYASKIVFGTVPFTYLQSQTHEQTLHFLPL